MILESSQARSDLSQREIEVLVLIADGLSTKEIAAKLGISSRMVNSHRWSLMQKLRLYNTALLTRYAVREGLVQP